MIFFDERFEMEEFETIFFTIIFIVLQYIFVATIFSQAVIEDWLLKLNWHFFVSFLESMENKQKPLILYCIPFLIGAVQNKWWTCWYWLRYCWVHSTSKLGELRICYKILKAVGDCSWSVWTGSKISALNNSGDEFLTKWPIAMTATLFLLIKEQLHCSSS